MRTKNLLITLTACLAIALTLALTRTNENAREQAPEKTPVQKEETTQPKTAPEEIGFKLEGEDFVLNIQHTATEKTVRDNSGRRIMRLFLVQNDYRQSLDMLFPVPDENNLPVTYKFADKTKVDPKGNDYAVCLFSSASKEGWHETPNENSTITITAWDPEYRLMTGRFELHIQHAGNKGNVIDITEGYFHNVYFDKQP